MRVWGCGVSETLSLTQRLLHHHGGSSVWGLVLGYLSWACPLQPSCVDGGRLPTPIPIVEGTMRTGLQAQGWQGAGGSLGVLRHSLTPGVRVMRRLLCVPGWPQAGDKAQPCSRPCRCPQASQTIEGTEGRVRGGK